MSALYIVRHGNTFEAGESPRRIGARTDLPLTATGIAQAQALGRHFAEAGIHFSRALTGPLRRTRSSAEIILAAQAEPAGLETAAFLDEIDHGPDENQPEAQVVARIGAAALDAWDRDGIAPNGWDCAAETRLAAWRELAGAASRTPDQSMLLVTSNGAARFALLAFGLTPANEAGALKLRTGSFGVISVGAGVVPRLVEWDRRPA